MFYVMCKIQNRHSCDTTRFTLMSAPAKAKSWSSIVGSKPAIIRQKTPPPPDDEPDENETPDNEHAADCDCEECEQEAKVNDPFHTEEEGCRCHTCDYYHDLRRSEQLVQSLED